MRIISKDLFDLNSVPFMQPMVETFDALLTERLGEEHDLQALVFNGKQLEITLLVPQ